MISTVSNYLRNFPVSKKHIISEELSYYFNETEAVPIV